MGSSVLRNSVRALSTVANQVTKTLTEEGGRTLSTIPEWGTESLIGSLNKLAPKDAIKGDDAAALRLYKRDVKQASPFYKKLACEVVLPHLRTAGSHARATGTKAPEHVVVVGATGGMGQEVAKHAAAKGARVSLLDMPQRDGSVSAALQTLADECTLLSGQGRVHAFPALATNEESMVRAMQEAASQHDGVIDVVTHTAGIFSGRRSNEVTLDHANLVNNVNARSTLVTANAAIPHLLKSQNPLFLFVSSMAAREFMKNQALYCWSKHHQHASMDTLGDLMSSHLRIRTTELLLGHVFTQMALGRGLPTEKMLKTHDVANLVWSIAEAPPEARFKALDVVPTERLEGKMLWPEAELARLNKKAK